MEGQKKKSLQNIAPSQSLVEADIGGDRYYFATDERMSKSRIRRYAREVDRRISLVIRSNNQLTKVEAAVLVALNLVEEFDTENRSTELLGSRVRDLSQEIEKYLEPPKSP